MAKGCAPSQLICTNLCLLLVETALGTYSIWDNYLNYPCVPYQPVLVCCSSVNNSTGTDDLYLATLAELPLPILIDENLYYHEYMKM